jgi:hypothetical protein
VDLFNEDAMKVAVIFAIATLLGAPAAHAQQTLRLAQSPAFSACMMTCNAVYMNCQQVCTQPGARITASPADASAASQCTLNCSTQQIVCQQSCAGR